MAVIGIHTLGCKVSQYESNAIKEKLERLGHTVVDTFDGCDVQIINTCTVTAEADRKCRSLIRRVARTGAKVIVLGCMTEIDPHAFDDVANVVYVAGTAKKLNAVDAVTAILAGNTAPTLSPSDRVLDRFEPMTITGFDRTRAYIKIEDGCESKCSYCIIPRARGKIRSKPKTDVVDEARGLIENGCHEIVLTGIEIDAWGRDLGDERLPDLVEAVNAINGDFRIRLGSLDPVIVEESFASRLAACEKVAPHFHLSVQSGSDRVLALMRRRYNAVRLDRAVQRLREAFGGCTFTCDVIVGFPGETEEDFLATCRMAERIGFIHMHIFPYSERPGTAAASLTDRIPMSERKARGARLSEIADRVRDRAVRNTIGDKLIQRVLTENTADGITSAHNASFVEFAITGVTVPRGSFLDVAIYDIKDGICYAKPVVGEAIER